MKAANDLFLDLTIATSLSDQVNLDFRMDMTYIKLLTDSL